MSSVARTNQYVDIKSNGKVFPAWVLHNFKEYKLPEILRFENEDPCNVKTKVELRKYQQFIGIYMGPGSAYGEILLYHGMGSGKTATAINIMNIMYNYDHNYTFVILIKASLRDDPWMKDLQTWIDNANAESKNITGLPIYKNIHFIHYDSPYANINFLDVMKTLDMSRPIAFIIDEVHRFISNVYSNINSPTGNRAQVIYEYILRTKKEIPATKIITISATPLTKNPFELALLFNLLRPGIFPTSESEFKKIFITDSLFPILNPATRNMFQRRILGLVSYYVGATPDLYAKQINKRVDLPMSAPHYATYRYYEKMEAQIEERARKFRRQSNLYKTYTRQSSNFVFPRIDAKITGESRPRLRDFGIDKMADKVATGILEKIKNKDKLQATKQYLTALSEFIKATEVYFRTIHKADQATDHTIETDLADFKTNFSTTYNESFLDFYNDPKPKSGLFNILYESSPKMLAIVFLSYISPGKVMVYTSYVIGEGIEVLKMYYRMIGFNDYTMSSKSMGYCEYVGRISKEERVTIKTMFNSKDNLTGTKCKVIMFSPSGSEGIELVAIRQEHILEPHWNEVRIKQVTGRGIRQCSHKDLPMAERVVTIYRYRLVKPAERYSDDTVLQSTDEKIEEEAKANENLTESFLSAMKEAAIDCGLFQAHNKMVQSYTCFSFPDKSLLGPHIGPAYKRDIKDDIKFNNGLNSFNSKVVRIKVTKINAVYILSTDTNGPVYSKPDAYWYYQVNGMVYDLTTHYPVGRVDIINDLPNKLDKDTYIISQLIDIPTIANTTVNP